MVDPQLRDRRLEVLERVEGLVDAREPQVGDLVEFAQRPQDREPDLVRVDLGRPGLAHRLLDRLGQHGEVGIGDRAALTGLADAGHDLLAAERLDDAGALDDVEAGGLDGREASAALRALAASTDARDRRRWCASRSTRESGWRQNGQCMAETDYPGRRASGLEAGVDSLAVGGKLPRPRQVR